MNELEVARTGFRPFTPRRAARRSSHSSHVVLRTHTCRRSAAATGPARARINVPRGVCAHGKAGDKCRRERNQNWEGGEKEGTSSCHGFPLMPFVVRRCFGLCFVVSSSALGLIGDGWVWRLGRGAATGRRRCGMMILVLTGCFSPEHKSALCGKVGIFFPLQSRVRRIAMNCVMRITVCLSFAFPR